VDVADDEVFVACASGEVVVLDPRLEVLRMAQIADDLRDIVIEGERAWLSRFRSAKVGRIDPQTLEVDFWRRPRFIGEERQARVAWRMRAHPDGGVLVLHQGAILRPIVLDLEVPVDPDIPTPSAYGGDGEGCRARRGPSTTHLSHVTVLGDVRTGGALMTPGPRYDFVLADRTAIFADGQPAPNPAATTSLHLADALAGTSCAVDRRSFTPSSAVVTAVGYTRDELWWFARDGARLVGGTGDRSLSGGAYEEGAFALFHEVRSAGIACASCHPEGQDDGHVWHFVDLGPRRTQNIAGGVAERAPFHWDGEFATLDELMDDVFVGRMGGEAVDGAGVDDLAAWMHEIPSLRSRPSDDALVAEGRDLFLGDAACAACHAGAQYTDAQLHVVREGEPPLKTPSLLGVGARAPYMHDGCAITLAQRFTDPACGGGDRHGTTSALSPGDVDALVAFLKSL
ncbi:MAG: c-type cytochrome, partial [Myxococcota bacterium]